MGISLHGGGPRQFKFPSPFAPLPHAWDRHWSSLHQFCEGQGQDVPPTGCGFVIFFYALPLAPSWDRDRDQDTGMPACHTTTTSHCTHLPALSTRLAHSPHIQADRKMFMPACLHLPFPPFPLPSSACLSTNSGRFPQPPCTTTSFFHDLPLDRHVCRTLVQKHCLSWISPAYR